MADMTFAQLIGAAAVILVLIGAYNTVMTAVKNHREEQKIKNSPLAALSTRVDKHDDLLNRDDERLQKLEKAGQDTEQQTRILLRAMIAMMSHELNGNSVDKLRESLTEINDYLINR